MDTPKKYNIKGAIFDLDGTLLDSESIYDKSHQELIIKYGNGKKYEWDVKKNVTGATLYDACKALIEGYEMRLTIEELMKIKNEILETAFENIAFMPGARELTHKLKHEFNIKNAVATSSAKRSFEVKTKHFKDY